VRSRKRGSVSLAIARRAPCLDDRVVAINWRTSAEGALIQMLAVIFEVLPKDGARDAYLGIAGDLRPLLDDIDDFISIERFESLSHPGKILSLSFWRDEEAIEAWRRLELHRNAQVTGRTELFGEYRLRVASVVRDYGMTEREQAPADSRAIHG